MWNERNGGRMILTKALKEGCEMGGRVDLDVEGKLRNE